MNLKKEFERIDAHFDAITSEQLLADLTECGLKITESQEKEEMTKATRLGIVVSCYAHVADEFAAFNNPKYRGPSFSWDWFVDHCEANTESWTMPKPENLDFAKGVVRGIAKSLVNRMQE